MRPTALLASLSLTALALLTAAVLPVAQAAEDYSPAERALFMSNQLSGLKPPLTLHYSFAKRGSLEENFDDQLAINLKAQADGRCCAAKADFLTGARRLPMPEIEQAEGNPAILYFLERDIKEMQRLTSGQANYFRKRIRMSVYQGAEVVPVSVPWRGKDIAAQQITISPYLDDPLRARFEKLANKQYVFTLSDAVPGGVYAIRTRIDTTPGGGAPLMIEELVLDGAASTTATLAKTATVTPARQP